MLKHIHKVILLVLCLIFLGVFCGTEDTFAYSATLTTNSSVTVNVVSTRGVSIHEESVNVVSDCRNGYNLSIATPEGSDLYRYENNTQASNTASITAVDGTSALNSSNNTNKWGYTLTSNPTSSTVFSPLSSEASVLKTASSTASTTDINDTFSINYGVAVDNTVASGSYRMTNDGSIVYYLTMDATCNVYTIEYNPNGGTGTIENQEIQVGVNDKLTSADSFTAPTGASYTDADNNTITGDPDKLWTFWGWNTEVDGTGDWYKDRESVTDLAALDETITLYAQWKQATLADMLPGTQVSNEKAIDHDTMQDMSPEICWNSTAYSTDTSSPAHSPYDSSTNTGGYHTITLKDYRGKILTGANPESPEEYTVSKLPDGLCWMTRNLELGSSTRTVVLYPEDTDIINGSGYGDFPLPNGDTVSNTVSTAWRIRLTNNSGTTANGTYYSWGVAIAGNASITTEATESICPKNWDLPSNLQFINLSSKSNFSSSNPTTAIPFSFLVDGGFTNGATFYQTSYSHFWTSTPSSSTATYGARVNATSMTTSSSIGNTYGANKYYRKNIRCVASRGKVTVNYDGNGTNEYPVTGSVASQENVEIATVKTQPGTGFTRNGWVFSGWNTAADGGGTSIVANASITTLDLAPGSTITLYAQWTPHYTITYVNNCMTYASTNSSCTQSVSDDISEQKINLTNNPSTGTETDTLAAYNKWTLTGWKIAGWTTNADGTGTEYRVSSTYTVPSGSSVGSGITLYAHWVPLYSIQYDGNGADNPNGMGTTDQSTGVKSVKQTNVGQGDPVVLLASNFKKAGYGFAGWSTDSDAYTHFTDNDNTNDPIIYGPMETISAPAYPTNGTNIITMYAVWVPAEKDGNNNPVYLQDFTASDCNALTKAYFNSTTGVITPGSVIALTDKRDNQVYTIAKLADDNCWMVENLRLEHDGTVGNNINDSNVTNQSLSQGYGGVTGTYGNFVGLADPESANFSNVTTSNSIYKSSAASPTDTYDPANNILEDIGSTNNPGYRFPRYNSNNTQSLVDSTTYTQNYVNSSNPLDSGIFPTANIYSYGNYYTWAAAMANTSYYTSRSGTSGSDAAGTSICPTNWHLPSSGETTQEFGTLSRSYGGSGDYQTNSKNIRKFPNNFLYSGNFSTSGANASGRAGYYWSRSVNSSTSNSYALYMHMDSTALRPTNGAYRGSGYSVRCLIGS